MEVVDRRREAGESDPVRDVIVLGAGITGLTAAFYLSRAGLSVTVLEAAGEVGGAIRTDRDGPWLFELGPNTIVESRPEVPRLLNDAGLMPRRLEARPASEKRYVWTASGLLPLPGAPLALLTSTLFSARAKLRLLREPWARRAAEEEESVAAFTRRRLGAEFLDRAVTPFVSGIWAGDPERLSIAWALPKLAGLEREHGSLLWGALQSRRAAGSAGSASGAMISLEGGLAELPRRLAELADVRLGMACRRLERGMEGDWVVEAEGFRARSSRLVVTLPAWSAGELLAAVSADASRRLAEIPYAPLAVVGLGYRREAVAHALDGFGFLTAGGAPRRRILGGLFTSELFPGRAPEDAVALTVFVGGRNQAQLVDREDSEILALAHEEVAEALGIAQPPIYRVLRRWGRAIPQYELGHAAYVAVAADLESKLPGLVLAGNYLKGISLPDCVARGVNVARAILDASRRKG